MQDVVGAVNDFILKYVKNNEVQPLSQDQIFRGWQNFAAYGPNNSQEYSILTLLTTIRHGTNIHLRRQASGDTGLINTVSRYAEHLVQVDFCSAYPNQTEENARKRAEILETLIKDFVAVNFFKSYGFSSCYADDLQALPFQDETEQWVARYIVTLHLSGWTATNIEEESFENIKLFPRLTQDNSIIQDQSGDQTISSEPNPTTEESESTNDGNTLGLYFENVEVHHQS